MTGERREQGSLPPELDELVRDEQRRPSLTPSQRRTLRERIDRAIDADLAHSASAADGPAPRRSAATLPSFLAGSFVGVVAGVLASWLWFRPAPAPIVARRTVAAHDDAPSRAVFTAQVASATPSAFAVHDAALRDTTEPPDTPSHTARGARTVALARHDEDQQLERERSLLEAARSALVRGDYSSSLVAVAEHEAQFRRGRLAEEREVLRIMALSRSGNHEETWSRAQVFLRRYPESISRAQIEALANAAR